MRFIRGLRPRSIDNGYSVAMVVLKTISTKEPYEAAGNFFRLYLTLVLFHYREY